MLNRPDPQGLPPSDVEMVLARHLYGQKAPLPRRILYALMGKPKRFSELAAELDVAHENSLTQALKVLRQEQVVTQRVDAKTRPITSLYELNTLGIDVVLAMERLRFAAAVSQTLPLPRSGTHA